MGLYRFLLGVLVVQYSFANVDAVDWSQPPLECIEETVPRPPRKRCPDLTKIKNPSFDFPETMSEADKKLWTTTYAKDLRI